MQRCWNHETGFEVLAFPCNQFASQEPGTIEEIKETACTVFKAEFPIFDKVIALWQRILSCRRDH